MGQNTNAGITNTQAAGSYMGYPSYEAWLLAQGGGGGGNGGGQDEIEEDTFSMGMSPGALGGKLPGFGNWAKRTAGTLGHIYSQLPTPTNLLMKGIRKWKENREIKKEQQRIAEDRTGIGDHDRGTFTGDHPDAPTLTPEQGGWHPGVGGNGGGGFTGAGAGSGSTGPPGRNYNRGGRIGLRPGGIVDVGKQYYGMDDWEIQQINKYGVSYPQFLQNQYGKGLHEMDIGEIATAVKAWDSWRSSQAEGGIARLL